MSHTSRWWALPVLLTAAFVTTLDFFIANVALPAIRLDLGASEGETQLVIAGYGLAYAAGVIIAGRLGDVHGPRRIFLAGLALFTLASAACGAAPSPSLLIAARIVQGAAAALMAPQVLTLLGALYQGTDRVKAFSWYGTAVGLAGIAGQVVGGLLMAADLAGSGWRACFLINLPLGAAGLLLGARLLPADGRTTKGRVDAPSALLIATALVAVVLPLTQGREQGWPLWSWLSLVAGAGLMGAFVSRQRLLRRVGGEPLLDMRVFERRGFVPGLVAVALLFGSSSALSFVLALHLQDAMGLTPLHSGAIFTALNAGFFTASLLARRAKTETPIAGAIALAGGFLLISLTAEPTQLIPGLFLAGAGMGLTMSPLLSMVMAHGSGDAAGVLGTVQEAGGVAGVTVAGMIFFAGGLGVTLAVLTGAALAIALLTYRITPETQPADTRRA
ncbi:MFS transporter [Nonomuraea sp. NPDC050556]|uniref:MFS transporter n=1 Tax=Nonomuraea sp. NPDC050556 TaxID=3364369 RepID=UPI0037961B72